MSSSQSSSQKSFKVYSASAGAGKTFNLVKEYLKVCLKTERPTDYGQILAVTFTIKAAGEMKGRILKALNAFRQKEIPSKYNDLFQAVRDDLGVDDSTLSRRAHAVLISILHNYSNISISTIDKFTYRLVRTFSHDLGLTSNFDVELDDQALYSQSIDLLLDESGRHPELTELLHRYVDRKMEDGKSWKPEAEILSMAKHLGKEESIQVLESVEEWTLKDFMEVRKKLDIKLKDFQKQKENLGKEGLELIALIPEEYFPYRDLPNYLRKLRHKDIKEATIGKRLRGYYELEVYTSKSANELVKSTIAEIGSELTELLSRCIHYQEHILPRALLMKEVLREYDGMAVLHEVSKKLKNYKEENNIESLSTFNRLIHQSLIELPAPYIYERIGEKYRHYFVDEFQDTSTLQWLNLTPLIHNAVASGGSAMIVGDAKQSIYRWRGGEAEQFMDLISSAKNPEILGGDVAYALEHIALNDNWRSTRQIVDFNNKFFSWAAQQMLHTAHRDLYAEGAQEIKSASDGYISVEFMDKSFKAPEFVEECLERILLQVRECEKDQFDIGDIAILVRNNRLGELVASKLTQDKIPVVSVDSLKLKNSSAVQAILSYIRIKLQPNDLQSRITLVQMLKQAGVIEMDPETFHNAMLAAGDKLEGSWEKWLETHGFLKDVQERNTGGLFEWGENAARVLKLIEDRSPDPFVQFFLDALYSFSQRKSHNILDFLDWWEETGQNESIAVPKSKNAVQIMSIHKAKGLEFPVVILPFVNFSPFHHADRRWVELKSEDFEGLPVASLSMSKDTAEVLKENYPSYLSVFNAYSQEAVFDNLNVLYVALTRPAERLYITSQMPSDLSKIDTSRGKSNEYLYSFLADSGIPVEASVPVEFGKKSAPIRKEEAGTDSVNLQSFVSNPWRGRVNLSRDTDGIADALSEQPRKWGNLIHNLLSEVHDSSSVDHVLEKAVAIGTVPSQYRNAIQITLEAVVQHPELQDSFTADKVYNERDWLGGGDVLRPDRISRKGECWAIVDYKTGVEKEDHKKQIRRYADLLLGEGKPAKAFLVYIGEEIKVVRVEQLEQLSLL